MTNETFQTILKLNMKESNDMKHKLSHLLALVEEYSQSISDGAFLAGVSLANIVFFWWIRTELYFVFQFLFWK